MFSVAKWTNNYISRTLACVNLFDGIHPRKIVSGKLWIASDQYLSSEKFKFLIA